jgi:hypothetical protein
LAQDALDVAHEPCRLLGGAQLSVGQAEGPHLRSRENIALGGTAADRVVLHEDDPIVLANVCEPALILGFLGDVLAVDRRHRVDREAESPERFGEVLASQAAIDEELGRFSHLARDYPTLLASAV